MPSRRQRNSTRRLGPRESEQPSHNAAVRRKRGRTKIKPTRQRIKPRRLFFEQLEDRRVLDGTSLQLPGQLFPGEQMQVADLRSVALGDINGDGYLDVVTGNDDDDVSVFLGHGDGTFAKHIVYRAGTNPRVVLGDVNADGNLDIVTANEGSNDVSILLGNGNGTFASETTCDVGSSPVSVTVGDLDGNGLLDIVTANRDSDSVSVLVGNGDGTFAQHVSYTVGSKPTSVTLGDFNNDGRLDIVTVDSDRPKAWVLFGQGDGTLAPPITLVEGLSYAVTTGDVNGDGWLDLVTADYFADQVSIRLSNGDGTFAEQTAYSVEYFPTSVAMGDVNGDGRLDVVVTHPFSGSVSILVGNGDGTFAEQMSFVVGGVPFWAALGDVNADGQLDIVTTNDDSISIVFGNGDGTFVQQSKYQTSDWPFSVSLGDLNADNISDIVVASYTGDVAILLGNGNGTFASVASHSTGTDLGFSSLWDVDDDGLLDLVTASFGSWSSAELSIFLGNGDGTFANKSTHEAGTDVQSLALGDFDLNGTLDFVTVHYGRDTISVYSGRNDGTFAPPLTYAGSPAPWFVTVGDVNGDGIPDVLIANQHDSITILLGHGDGTFAPQMTHGAGRWPQHVGLGDINGDGGMDLVAANYGSHNVSILLGNGDGTFAEHATYDVGRHPGFVTLGDVNQDGALDVVTANSYSNNISILLGKGDGTFARQITYAAGYWPVSVALGDLNRDGRLDILSADLYSNSISLLLGRFQGISNSPAQSVVPPIEVVSIDFSQPMDISSFALADDIASFTGPGGPITPVGFSWEDDRELRITFPAQTLAGSYEMVLGPYILDAAGSPLDLDRDDVPGEIPDDQYVAGFWIKAPRVTQHSPRGTVAGPLNTLQLLFDEAMDRTSFSLTEDIASFTGPLGPVQPMGFSWTDERTLLIHFDGHAAGRYTLVLGAEVLDVWGNALDLDGDLILGEISDDRYVATFSIQSPSIAGHIPRGRGDPPLNSVQVMFDQAMDTTSFSLAEDVVSFTGPLGQVTPTGFAWIGDRTLEIHFQGHAAGEYTLILGAEILDAWGNALDLDRDFVLGELPDDQYAAAFSIKAPRVTGHMPSDTVWPPVESLRLTFDRAMDTMSFALADDVVSLTGPQGPLTPSRFAWVDERTLEVEFDGTAPGTYQLVLAASVHDRYGNPLDQDQDGVLAEPIDDCYTATWNVSYSGTMDADSTWRAQQRAIVLDSSLTIPAGKTLTVEAGTVVKFAPGVQIRVDGTLRVRGTAAQPVVFTSLKDDTVGGDTNGDGGATIPAAGDWRGLVVGSSGQIEMDHFRLQYATDSINANATGAQVKLNSGILRDGSGHGIYVHSPYAEVIAENCIIADHRFTGLYMRADSRHVFRNCTIVGNGFGEIFYYGGGIHLGGTNLTLDNCIVAFNKNGLSHEGDPPLVTVRNSVFHNPIGQEVIWDTADPGRLDLPADGNLTADPLFVDRAAGNYELAAGSPAIDAGRGIQAPATDLLGRLRYDDRGMPNVGIGYPAFIDIGAYERQADTMAGDLAVLSVSPLGPVELAVSGTLTVEWTVANVGAVDVVGLWTDAVYLSRDPHISPDDILLERRAYDGTLNPGAKYTQTLTAAAPGTAGVYYVLVRANADKTPSEPAWANNFLAAPGVLAVGLPTLNVGSSVSGTVAHGRWQYVALQATPGNTVQLSLDAAAQRGATALYVRFGAPPTLDAYDDMAAVANSPDQQLRILSPQQGIYYVGVYGTRLSGGSTTYILTAARTELAIHKVTPSTVGNAGPVTIKIEGDNFHPDTQVQLVGADGTVIETTPLYQDTATVFATFDLSDAGADSGRYDVTVIGVQQDVTKTDAITLTEGERIGFTVSIRVPALARPGRIITIKLEYRNDSLTDITAPVLCLDSYDQVSEWQLPGGKDWISGPELYVQHLSTDGHANVLRPGQVGSVEIRARLRFEPGPYRVAVSRLDLRADQPLYDPAQLDELDGDVRPSPLRIHSLRGDGAIYLDEALGLPAAILTGVVANNTTGEPVPGVTVTVENIESARHVHAKTDSLGRFILYDLDPSFA